MDEATNVKICSRMEGRNTKPKNFKMGQKGACLGHLTYF